MSAQILSTVDHFPWMNAYFNVVTQEQLDRVHGEGVVNLEKIKHDYKMINDSINERASRHEKEKYDKEKLQEFYDKIVPKKEILKIKPENIDRDRCLSIAFLISSIAVMVIGMSMNCPVTFIIGLSLTMLATITTLINCNRKKTEVLEQKQGI